MGTTIINEGSLAALPAAATAQGPKLTYSDVIERLDSFCRGHGRGADLEMLREATWAAYDEVVHARPWSTLRGAYRLFAHAAQTDGTVDYDHDTLTLTLSDATWPTWAGEAGAAVIVDGVFCPITRRQSTTAVLLDSNRNPGEDLSGESYTLFEAYHTLPADWLRNEEPTPEDFVRLGQWIPWEEMVHQYRWYQDSGSMQLWSIGPDSAGNPAIWIHPPLSADVRIEVPYRKRARELRYSGQQAEETQGTVSVTGTGVTGSGTAFADAMVGAVLRVASGTALPTARTGVSPYAQEGVIASVDTATALTLENDGDVVSDRAYRVSDPIDLPRAAHAAMIAVAKRHLALVLELKDAARIEREAERMLADAKGADATGPRQFVPRAGYGYRRPRRLADQYIP